MPRGGCCASQDRSGQTRRSSAPGRARASRARRRRCVRTHRPSSARGPRARASAPVGSASQRQREHDCDRGREEPPRVHALVRQECGERESDRDACGHAPVVADDEVPPEAAERAEILHASAPAVTRIVRLRRSAPTSTRETSPKNAITASSESSSPGQSTPAPSAPQKQPKLVSRRPTAYLIVFSGTCSSGPRARTPAPTTSTKAAAAPAAARPILFWALPKEITMKTTSSPSSRTPLKATVNEYQSRPALSSRPAFA